MLEEAFDADLRQEPSARRAGFYAMRIDLTCSACGGNNFTLDEAVTDDCSVDCRDCGHSTGTLHDLKQQVVATLLQPRLAAVA